MKAKQYFFISAMILCIVAFFPLVAMSNNDDATFNKHDKTEEKTGSFKEKDEVIYGKLTPNGIIENMYVVNTFHVTEQGVLTDYGAYKNVRNLTDLSEIEKIGRNTVTFTADEDFYYQGELENTDLPWDITITYMLNGEEVEPSELVGASGSFEMRIKTEQNKAIDPLFFDYYLLQISVTLDPLHFTDVQAPKGTEANEGKDKLISFNVMPGEEEILILTAEVVDFELEPVHIAGIPANIAFDRPDTDELAKEMKQLSDAIRDVNDGVTELKNGVIELEDGATTLSDGSKEYATGINILNSSSNELVNGSKQILNVLQQIDGMVDADHDLPVIDDLTEIENIIKSLRDVANELRNAADDAAYLTELFEEMTDEMLTEAQFGQLYEALENSDIDDRFIKMVESFEHMYELLEEIQLTFDDMPFDYAELLREMANNIDTVAHFLEELMQNLNDIGQIEDLIDGLTTLTHEYETFHHGLIDYTDGVHELEGSYGQLNSGMGALADGTSALSAGVSELHEGTEELTAETSDLATEMQSEIDQFMEEFDYSDFEVQSFVSERNKRVGVVQFVLQTESIKKDTDDTIVAEENVKKGMWRRFLDLFN